MPTSARNHIFQWADVGIGPYIPEIILPRNF